MRAVTAFLLGLCFLAISHAWRCDPAPQLENIVQVDAGQGKVVAVDKSSKPYFLIGSSWHRLTRTRFSHVSVGRAGLWGTSTRNRVYKYVGGIFLRSRGLSMRQVDAGGDQLVGVSSDIQTPLQQSSHHSKPTSSNGYRSNCVTSTDTSLYTGVGTLRWKSLPNTLKYYSCGPLFGCWGVTSNDQIYVTKSMTPTTCSTSGWTRVSGGLSMIEVATDGSVFGVNRHGHVYQRIGITSDRPEGKRWVRIPMCMKMRHLSYDLGKLWVVTTSGLLLKCTP